MKNHPLNWMAALFVALLLLAAPSAHAQLSNAQVVTSCGSQSLPTGAIRSISQDPTGKTCTAASVSASIAAFSPTAGATQTLAVTTTTARSTALTGSTQLIQNTGSVDAYLVFGNSAVNATTSGTLLRAGYAVAYDVSVNGATNVAAITASGSTSLTITGGAGLPALAGASSGGGGGGAITAAASSYAASAFSLGAGVDGWDLTQGAKADAACGTDNGTCSIGAVLKRIAQNLTTLNTTAGGAIPAGTAIIGKVGVDQTTPGITNAFQVIAGTTGGTTAYGLQTAASTNSTSVKGSAGVLYGMNLINTTTTIYYLRMYDAASAPTCSSATNFVRTWPVPPAAAAGGGGGVAVSLPLTGTQFSNGIGFCVTGGPSSTDNTNAATGVFINLDYK